MKKHKPNRLQNYNYSQNGMYFVTICTQGREELFGEIVDGKMNLNESGKIADKNLQEIPNCFENVFLDCFVIMPNHIHLIIEINVGVRFIEPENNTLDKSGFDKSNPYEKYIKNNPMLLNKTTLGKIIRYYKAKTTNKIRTNIKFWKFAWQRNYYDRIIRNEIELNKIREYISINPQMWERDRNKDDQNIWM